MEENSNLSLTPIISEEDFLAIAQKDCQDFMAVLNVITDDRINVNKFYYFTLLQEAEKLESVLDDHGARSNLRWLYLAGSIRK